jgi:hypothetical protein
MCYVGFVFPFLLLQARRILSPLVYDHQGVIWFLLPIITHGDAQTTYMKDLVKFNLDTIF